MALKDRMVDELDSEDSFWLKGEFSGTISGTQRGSHGYVRTYDVTISNGEIKNLSKVDEPPLVFPSHIPQPVLQEIIKDVYIEHDDKVVQIDLHSFRLHDWKRSSPIEIRAGKSAISMAQIIGMAYFRMRPENKRPMERLVVEPQRENNPVVSGDSPSNTAQAVNSSAWATENPPQTSPQPPDTQSHYSEAALPSPGEGGCLACSWLFRLFLAGMVWYFCGLWPGLVFLAVTLFPCRFQHSGIGNIYVANILGALLAIISLVWLFNVLNCHARPDFPVLPGLALTFSFIVRRCGWKLLLSLMWLLAILMWCGGGLDGCRSGDGDWLRPLSNKLENLGQKISDLLIPNEDDAIRDKGRRKITIDQALANQELMNECGNSVYFPEATLFSFDKAAINPGAEGALRKLSSLLEKYPGRAVSIVGHTDAQGEGTSTGVEHNYELSRKRAQSVADWLVKQNRGSNEFEVIGLGAKSPILENATSEAELRRNRRVEIQLRCNN